MSDFQIHTLRANSPPCWPRLPYRKNTYRKQCSWNLMYCVVWLNTQFCSVWSWHCCLSYHSSG